MSEYECPFKGIVQPKMKILSIFTCAHVIQNIYGFLSSTQQKKIFWRILITKRFEWTKTHLNTTEQSQSYRFGINIRIHFWLACPFKSIYVHLRSSLQICQRSRRRLEWDMWNSKHLFTSDDVLFCTQYSVLFSWDDGGKTLFSWDGGVKILFSSDGSVKLLC